jgi:hypothetical protein
MSETQDRVKLPGDDAGLALLRDIRDVFEKRGVDRMASVEIVEALVKREDRPWSKWKGGKPITPRQLARLLEPFAVSPTTIWSAGRAAKGYLLASFAGAFVRYVPARDTPPNGSRGIRNPQKSANPNRPTVGNPESPEGAPATPTSWIQYNDRRWPA